MEVTSNFLVIFPLSVPVDEAGEEKEVRKSSRDER